MTRPFATPTPTAATSLFKKMKILSSILVLTAAFSNMVQANAPSRPSFVAKSRVTTDKVLKLRGGDAKDNALLGWSTLYGAHGLVSMAAPETMADGNYGFTLTEGNPGYVFMEKVGAAMLACLTIVLLAKKTTLDTTKVIAWSALPCAYTMTRRLLKGSYASIGFRKGFGSAFAGSTLAFMTAIILGVGDATLFCNITVAVLGGFGLLGMVSKDTAANILGLSNLDPVSGTMLHWWCSTLAQYAIIAYSLMQGKSVAEIVGYASAFFSIDLLDCFFVRKHNDPIKPDMGKGGFFVVLMAVIATVLLN